MLAADSGYSPSVIAKIVGHSSTQMIDRNYGHLFRQHREDMVRAIRGERPIRLDADRPGVGKVVRFPVRVA